jgi:tRNA(fMet)-specific endonuclease VapC
MQIPILIERVNGNGYRSRGGEQFALSAEGATREEVLAALQAQLQERLRGGAEVISLEVSPGPHPLAHFAGMFKDDPLFESWQKSIAKYRREVDADPGYRWVSTSRTPTSSLLPILSFTEPAIERYEDLKRLKLKVKKIDLRIAAIVLQQKAVLVTRNSRDFSRISGLRIEDWSSLK